MHPELCQSQSFLDSGHLGYKNVVSSGAQWKKQHSAAGGEIGCSGPAAEGMWDLVALSPEHLQVDLDPVPISSQPGFRMLLLPEILLLCGYNSFFFFPLYALGTFPPLAGICFLLTVFWKVAAPIERL